MPHTHEERRADENIASALAQAAHDALLQAMPSLGLTPSNNSGHAKAVRLHDVENRYLFSWIPAKAHLLFYIRKPALNAAPQLRHSAKLTGLQTAENPAGEVTIRIEKEADAQQLIKWLAASLPLCA